MIIVIISQPIIANWRSVFFSNPLSTLKPFDKDTNYNYCKFNFWPHTNLMRRKQDYWETEHWTHIAEVVLMYAAGGLELMPQTGAQIIICNWENFDPQVRKYLELSPLVQVSSSALKP